MDAVRIEWLLPDGRGAGRGARGLVRVEGAIPGDTVKPHEIGRKGRTVDAELAALLEASPDRRDAPCPWSASCGGCDLGHHSPSARRAALARMVAHSLDLQGSPEVIPSPREMGHRARIKLAIDGGRIGYRPRRSHDLVAPDVCAIARPELNALLERVRGLPPEVLDRARSVELRSDGARAVAVFEGDGAPPDGLVLPDSAWNGRPITGDPTLSLEVMGHTLRARPRAFFQVNLEANRLLVEHVVQRVMALGPERILDLYAGIGNLTLPLAAASGVPVSAVEIAGDGVGDLAHNAAEAGLPIEVHRRPVERHDPARTPFDVAVLDPPRVGAKGVLPRLLALRPKGLVYVSCDIRSARRDLAEIRDSGYRLADVRCFDLFPDTHHIETVLVLERP